MRFKFAFLFVLCALHGSTQSLNVFWSTTPETCSSSNGTINVSSGGGTPPYTYIWSTGSTTSNLSGLSAGTYTVTVTDINADTGSANIMVSNSSNLGLLSMSYFPPGSPTTATWPCNSQCNGIAYLDPAQIAGGIPPFYISLETSTNMNIVPTQINGYNAVTNVCNEDIYSVRVFDVVGCSSIVYMGPFFPLTNFHYVETIVPACFGLNTGSVTLDFDNLVSGLNSSALVVNYSGPSTGTAPAADPIVISNLLPGIYTITAQYSMNTGCDTTFNVVVPDLGLNCGVISGNVYLDTIADCAKDVNEPSAPQQLIRFDPGAYYATSDSAGNYSAALPYATYTATLLSTNPLFPVCNVNGLNLTAANDTIANVDLGDSINLINDISVGLTSSAFRPGFLGILYPTVYNLSIDSVPNPVLDIYYDTLLTYQPSSAYVPVINVPGHLSYNLNGFSGFGSSSFHIQFQVPADITFIGTPLIFSAVVNSNLPEPDTSNNSYIMTRIITGSLDPNDKMVDPSRDSMNTFYLDLDDVFSYTIRFQNTGTDTTFNVVVIDTLDANLDPSTLQIIAFSHPMRWELSGLSTLKFYFDNILLPDSNTNEAASHGAITYSIKPQSFVQGNNDYIYNRADIYFDFNPPVLTNTVSSLITVSVGLNESIKRVNLKLVPNPASDYFTLKLPADFEAKLIQIYNMIGQVIMQTVPSRNSQLIDVSILPEGYYILKVQSMAGNMISGGLVIQR